VDEQPTDDLSRYENAYDTLDGQRVQFGCAPRGRFDEKLKADLRSAIRYLRGGGQ
jgi:hypothetical protein